jgi:hypothetical protein
MSELKVDKVSPRSGTYVSLNTVGSKNILINGDMSIAQRGTSASGKSTGGYFTCDRWNFSLSSLGTWTLSQDTDVPTGQGFATSFKLDCTTADASPSSTDRLQISQTIEGQNLQYLKYGSSNAETLTASFWVKSNKTGTYTLEMRDLDNLKDVSQTYTIDIANTWEKKTVSFPANTSDTFDNDNGGSLSFEFWLGAGSAYTSGTLNTTWSSRVNANRVSPSQVNLADSTSNDWFVTGVQLEAGTTASDFEFLPYDMNYSRCNRYYQDYTEGNTIIRGYGYNTSAGMDTPFTFKTPMRAAPTMTEVSGTDGGSNTTLTNFGAIKTYGCDFNTDPTTSNQTNFYSFKFTADAEL